MKNKNIHFVYSLSYYHVVQKKNMIDFFFLLFYTFDVLAKRKNRILVLFFHTWTSNSNQSGVLANKRLRQNIRDFIIGPLYFLTVRF